MKDTAKNVITLTIITLVAGLLLGYVYDITKKPIEDMKQRTKQEAYKTVFAEADTFSEDEAIDIASTENIISDNNISGVSVDEIVTALDSSNNKLGYVFTTTSREGYGGDITISVGIRNDGTVLGVEILEISETAGLGMKAKEQSFKDQFANKNVSKFEYTKSGASLDNEIDALSGATITTKAFTNAVNAALAVFNTIGGGVNA